MRALAAARESHRDGLSANTVLTCLGIAEPCGSTACDTGMPALAQSSQGFCAGYKIYQLGFVGFCPNEINLLILLSISMCCTGVQGLEDGLGELQC